TEAFKGNPGTCYCLVTLVTSSLTQGYPLSTPGVQ
ncbi:unnamed protein product, partial [marine sediment metagenome]